jgi:hypothetical protein
MFILSLTGSTILRKGQTYGMGWEDDELPLGEVLK